jgi:hypothetical protein
MSDYDSSSPTSAGSPMRMILSRLIAYVPRDMTTLITITTPGLTPT